MAATRSTAVLCLATAVAQLRTVAITGTTARRWMRIRSSGSRTTLIAPAETHTLATTTIQTGRRRTVAPSLRSLSAEAQVSEHSFSPYQYSKFLSIESGQQHTIYYTDVKTLTGL